MNMRKNGSLLQRLFSFSGYALFVGLLLGFPGLLSAQSQRIATGDDFGAVIDGTGNLFLWGAILDPMTGGIEQVPGSWREVSVSRTAAAEAHILAIASDGTLWAWGNNDRGQLGVGDQTNRASPVQISSLTTWVEVATGESHSLARRSNGRVFAWGDNTYGQLNTASVGGLRNAIPSSSVDSNSYIAISAGNAHSHAIRNGGTLWTWGTAITNDQISGPQLGILVNNTMPIGAVRMTRVGTASGWTDLFGGYNATFAIRSGGQLWVWGSGPNLGLGSIGFAMVPTRVGTATGWASVSFSSSTSAGHAVGLRTNGDLYGWGVNAENIDPQTGLPLGGALGLSVISGGQPIYENFNLTTPRRLQSSQNFSAVGAGEQFSVLLNDAGFLLSAGINDMGQLANGTVDSGVSTGQPSFGGTEFGSADLVAVAVTINDQIANITAGSTVSLSVEMRNDGTGGITDSFTLQARLNTSASFGGEALNFTGGPSFTVTDDFIAGQSRIVDVSVILPTEITQGSYYIVFEVDAGNSIEENSENNNTAATGNVVSFLPDLAVTTAPAGLTVTSSAPYNPSNDDVLSVDLLFENLGSGTLPAGSAFDVRLFLSPSRSATSDSAVEWGEHRRVTLAADLEAGAVLSTPLTFSAAVPFTAPGAYFVGVELDVDGEIAEQPELRDDLGQVVRENGENNNAGFSAAPITVAGLSIEDAVDQAIVAVPGPDGVVAYTTGGDAEWFGQEVFARDGIDAAQSPALSAGESASFSATFSTAVAISFDWSANTSSQQNRLVFDVINGPTGGNSNSIAGNTDGWVENVIRVIPANAQAKWTYEQGVDAFGDRVYVDDLQFTTISGPDLVIDDIYLPQDASGTYVLQRDRLDLTMNSRNQGTSTTPGESYVLSLYLSRDAIFDRPDSSPLTTDDILIRQLTVDSGIDGGDAAVNGFSINLDDTIAPGSYYVIGYIDDYTDASGNLLPGIVGASGEITEFTGSVGGGAFPGEENNLFITESAIVEIQTLPDLEASSLSVSPDFFLISGPAENDGDVATAAPADPYAEPNSLMFEFTVRNSGLSGINVPFEIQALFSRDQVLDASSDYTFLEYIYSGSLGDVVSGANVQTIRPDQADFRQNIVNAGYIGERLFFGVLADSNLEITELFENNNGILLFENDLILSEFSLEDALDLTDARMDELGMVISNDEEAPYSSSSIPWVGQSTTTFDGFDAAASVLVGDNETSSFSMSINPDVPVRLSFWWKVSSQNELIGGFNQRDVLEFRVNGVEAVPSIYGTEEENWRRVQVTLPSGQSELTWSYVKDGQGKAGEDRGWVDQISVLELPNLTATGISIDGTSAFGAGGTVGSWSFDIGHTGQTIPAGTAFDIELRLLPTASWDAADAVTLLTITDVAGLAEGDTRRYDQTSHGALTLPSIQYEEEYYHFAAYVDWSSDDPSSGQVAESDESEADNARITASASVRIGRPDLSGSDASFSGVDPAGYSLSDSVDFDLIFSNIGAGALVAGESFDYSVYATRTSDAADFNSSSTIELGSGTVTLGADVAAGVDLPSTDFITTLPFGLAAGDYFLAVQLDTGNDISEQDLIVPADPENTLIEGELNNLFYSSARVFTVAVTTVFDAVNDSEVGSSAAYLESAISDVEESAAFWFGRSDEGDVDTISRNDDQVFTDGNGAQTPELDSGEISAFRLAVEGSSFVKFDWGAETGSESNVLSVWVNDVLVSSISGSVALGPIDAAGILVPEDGFVEWRYTKGVETARDYAFVDNIEVSPNSDPDLVLTRIDYTPGEYVLDVAGIAGDANQLLGTEYLDITVEATNFGADIPAINFTTADIEILLSTNRIYGDEDDFRLGTVNQVEGNLESGNLIRFVGPLQLGDDVPEGTYYLIARIDPNDRVVSEFSEANNIMIAENRDVQITRLPALRLYNPAPSELEDGPNFLSEFIDTEEGIVFIDPVEGEGAGIEISFDANETNNHYTESAVRLRFGIQNLGLDAVRAFENWTVRFTLLGASRTDLADAVTQGDLLRFLNAFTNEVVLGDFNVSEYMEGRTDANPDGEILDFDVELALPSGARFNSVIDPTTSLENYLWLIQVDIDPDLQIRQSEIIREAPALVLPSEYPWRVMDVAEAFGANLSAFNTDQDDGLFGIRTQPERINASTWEGLYDDITTEAVENPYPVTEPDNLLAYAFYRNPMRGDTVGEQFPGSYGTVELPVSGPGGPTLNYRYLSFDIVTRADDLIYYVEAADGGDFVNNAEVLLTIEPPFIDLVGEDSLTGENGLIDQDYVLSVLDQGYSARVQVRDSEDLSQAGAATRAMRVRVERIQRVAELELSVPGTGIVGSDTYVKGGSGFQLVLPSGPLQPGSQFDVNFDVFSSGQIEVSQASVQIRLVSSNTGTVETLDWSSATSLDEIVLVDQVLDLNQTLGAERYAVVRGAVDIPENIVGSNNYYVAVWVDYLNEVASESSEANNLAFSGSTVNVSNPITIEDAIDSDDIGSMVVVWTQTGDALWYPVYDEDAVPTSGSAPAGARGDEALRSPVLGAGQTAALRTSFGAIPRVLSFDWYARNTSADSKFSVVAVSSGEVLFEASEVSTEWQRDREIIVPADTEIEFRFTPGASDVDSGDFVFIDNLRLNQDLTAPDFILTGFDLSDESGTIIQSGSYVLQRDPLFVNVSAFNQGTDSTGNFRIELYLSSDQTLDATDTLIRDYTEDRGTQFLSGNSSVNGFSIDLPTTLAAGNYYLIGRINPDGAVDENGRDFNNTLVRDGTLEIVRLPDLVIANFNADPNYYFVQDPGGGRGFLDFEFEIANQGLAEVEGPLSIKVLLSGDTTLDPDLDYVLLEYTFNGSLAAGSSQLIDPDSVDLRDNVALGEFQFMGAIIDSENVAVESDDSNNTGLTLSNDFVFSLNRLQDSLDITDSDISDLNITLVNDQQAPYDSLSFPWVGQSARSFDGVDAVSNSIIGDNQTARFSMTIDPDVPVRVSFWWRVSSEDDPQAGQRDVLGFNVDGVEAVPSIYGVEELDWQRVEVILEAGPHTLEWVYVKDGQGSAGEDRGWIDQISVVELPNLQTSGITVNGTPTYEAGTTIDNWSLDIVNAGRAIPAGTEFEIELRLLTSNQWVESGSVTLLTITDTAGIGAGATRRYDQVSQGVITLPTVQYEEEYYHFGAYVDWFTDDPASGQIGESNETDADNAIFTEEASVRIGRPDLIGSNASFSGIDPGGYSFAPPSNVVDLDLTFTNAGAGALAAGASFNYSVYITRSNDELDFNSSSTVLLGSSSVTLAADVISGADLPASDFSAELPFGLASGDYFLAVELDTGNAVSEQDNDPDDADNVIEGEQNNLFFTTTSSLGISIISLFDALHDGGAFVAGDIANVEESAAFWFGRNDEGDADGVGFDDDQVFAGSDGAQTPVLQAGEFAAFTLQVTDSSVVTFDWGTLSGSDLNSLAVFVNGVLTASISGDVPLAPIAAPGILVPENGVVEWRYTKLANTTGDYGLVDNIQVTLNTLPDLVLSRINYTAGEYVLDVAGIAGNPDQLLGTEYLDITVEATNRGETITATQFTTADLEVLLSTNEIYGDADDILLGTVNQVEGNLASGGLLRFIGPIQLGDAIPEGTYHLIARIDPNDEIINEFSDENNVLITSNRDVQITRLPALRIYNPNANIVMENSDGVTNFLDPRETDPNTSTEYVAFDIDEDINYFTESPMRVRFTVQNIGLDRIEATESWTVTIDLLAALREDLNNAQLADPANPDDYFDAFNLSVPLGDFTVSQLMEGRSESLPDGQRLDFDIELALPSGARLNALIEANRLISEYLWALEVRLDADNTIRESSIIGESPARVIPTDLPWRIVNPIEGLSGNLNFVNTDQDEGGFGISFQPEDVDAENWESDYFGYPTILEENLLAYAFNRNPVDSDTLAGQFPGTYGINNFEGDDVFSITFDMITRSNDLVYYVEAADLVTIAPTDAGYSLLTTVDGPYDQLTGSSSLTGDGGLIEDANVIGILDQGYTARITVKDDQIVGASATRFLQVRVEGPFDAYVTGLLGAGNGPYDDFDGDGENNLVEILTGATILDAGNPADGFVAPEADLITASSFATRGILHTAANRGPSDDYDSDGYANIVELILGNDPASPGSTPTSTVAEAFVILEMALQGVLPGTDRDLIGDVALDADYDGDGDTNIVEFQNDTDPTDAGDTPADDSLRDYAVTGMANAGVFGDPAPANIGDDDDFDLDGINNLEEIFVGTDPNDVTDTPLLGDIDTVVDDYIDTNYVEGNYTAAGNADGDAFTNIEEIVLGTNPTVAN